MKNISGDAPTPSDGTTAPAATPTEDDETPRSFRASLLTAELHRGSKVAVGFAEDGSGVLVQLTNNRGTLTEFFMSVDAAAALRKLLSPRPHRAAGRVVSLIYRLAETAAPDDEARGTDADAVRGT